MTITLQCLIDWSIKALEIPLVKQKHQSMEACDVYREALHLLPPLSIQQSDNQVPNWLNQKPSNMLALLRELCSKLEMNIRGPLQIDQRTTKSL